VDRAAAADDASSFADSPAVASAKAEGADIRRQSRVHIQRVEDNAFHLAARLNANLESSM
jgi:hypothetical protein